MIPIPKGFSFGAMSAGFKNSLKYDLGVVLCETEAPAAGVFTQNAFPAAPVQVARDMLAGRKTARAVCINSGQANAATGDRGMVDCRLSLEMLGDALGIPEESILPASTGVIGVPMDMAKWRDAAPELAGRMGKSSPMDFARAIMTTDAFPKVAWANISGLPGSEGPVRVLGFAKGAGMICPNMATMLSVVLTDAEVEPALLREVLAESVSLSFNRIIVDGDTSTNDTVYAMASGASGAKAGREHKDALSEAFADVCQALAYMIVEDGEGATKVVRIAVTGARDNGDAEKVARAVGKSPLVKTALFGKDPNWGRILGAVGYSGAAFDPDHVTISMGKIPLFRNGHPVEGESKQLLAPHMRRQDIEINIDLGAGGGHYEVLASDLGHGYVRINAEYTS
ncbi:bifunctional ornithine acetyltransferase/N-acetylglutamate synthase [Oceanidesulfovibrio indonesiensis]|uniref:Arginine biosynthesis bifunctional protein ArgJ n=1 Tax=Oceanidesulfovibrio indonesiensis TaxID=54767 RepID=A0A7M3MDJ1_9BACT|nr:bifunctional glutamate N-acetyltransferase/amino-acid acetyltransferase ArgJ [Oceanidesulfovibrio indonesiensis]TVM16192.1 bifunctional ornithine acetyltransferase/N-acetylglutamate synthase [Oceanidesulfovibrio indonesiensis]